jgi:phosphopantothenoylcysteine decarboxylase/phosphopantothenate--cysteine ligase
MSVCSPIGARVRAVESTEEMADAVNELLPNTDVMIMAAAPADFRPAHVATSKIKKSAAPDAVRLAPTPDILSTTKAVRRAGTLVVGFALETDNPLEGGRAKLEAKDLDLIVVNDASEPGAGFTVDTNRVTLLARGGGEERLPLMSKADVADAILDRVEEMLRGR